MKEKYLFFTLLMVALIGLLVGSRTGQERQGKISEREKRLERRLKLAAKNEPALPEKLDMERIQDLVAFSYYEGMLKRSPFVKVKPRKGRAVRAKTAVLPVPVEEKTPLFIYKGKIVAGKREVVIIEQTRTAEVFMVSKGESIDGYKVLDITDTEVILSKKGEEEIVLKTTEAP